MRGENPVSPRRRAPRGPESLDGAGRLRSLLTLTVAHDQEDALGYLQRAEAQGWHKIVSGKAYQQLKDRLGIAGTCTAPEVTRGGRGWKHPHLHNLVWHDRYWQAEDFAAFHAYACERWAKVCAAYHLRPPHPVHGVDIQPNANAAAIASYVTKLQEGAWTIAEEVTRSDVKTGQKASRTPFEILRGYYATGDRADWALWCEYLTAVRGKAGSALVTRSHKRLTCSVPPTSPTLPTRTWPPTTLAAGWWRPARRRCGSGYGWPVSSSWSARWPRPAG